jgi:hypothetical protein
MLKEDAPSDGGQSEDGHGQPQREPVEVTIDGRKVAIEPGRYVVTRLKELLGVPPDYELDRVVGQEFKKLDDAETVQVHKGEVFVSHVRRGGSS